jgi:1,4-alpha-glucan branching enzyme
MEWLHEAAAETYLPLLRVLRNLERDRVPANFNISFSPILLEQLVHPFFVQEFPKYLTRKIVAAREDEAFFIQSGDLHLTETARFWGRFFNEALADFKALNGDILSGFRHFNDIGMIEVMTSGATHGYMPLLGTDESVRAQIRTAVSSHTRHLGKAPRGIWIPECGYRPAGVWKYPIADAGSVEARPEFDRIGVEQAFSIIFSSTRTSLKIAGACPLHTALLPAGFPANHSYSRRPRSLNEVCTSPTMWTVRTTSAAP